MGPCDIVKICIWRGRGFVAVRSLPKPKIHRFATPVETRAVHFDNSTPALHISPLIIVNYRDSR